MCVCVVCRMNFFSFFLGEIQFFLFIYSGFFLIFFLPLLLLLAMMFSLYFQPSSVARNRQKERKRTAKLVVVVVVVEHYRDIRIDIFSSFYQYNHYNDKIINCQPRVLLGSERVREWDEMNVKKFSFSKMVKNTGFEDLFSYFFSHIIFFLISQFTCCAMVIEPVLLQIVFFSLW